MAVKFFVEEAKEGKYCIIREESTDDGAESRGKSAPMDGEQLKEQLFQIARTNRLVKAEQEEEWRKQQERYEKGIDNIEEVYRDISTLLSEHGADYERIRDERILESLSGMWVGKTEGEKSVIKIVLDKGIVRQVTGNKKGGVTVIGEMHIAVTGVFSGRVELKVGGKGDVLEGKIKGRKLELRKK